MSLLRRLLVGGRVLASTHNAPDCKKLRRVSSLAKSDTLRAYTLQVNQGRAHGE